MVVSSSVEFIVAQTPNRMRGFMVGLWITIFGIGPIANKLLQCCHFITFPQSVLAVGSTTTCYYHYSL